jgi:hypothetical protein
VPSHTDAIHAAITEHGGVATSGQLRERWGLSTSRMHTLMQMPEFPAPVAMVGKDAKQAVYSLLDADAFREEQKTRRGNAE